MFNEMKDPLILSLTSDPLPHPQSAEERLIIWFVLSTHIPVCPLVYTNPHANLCLAPVQRACGDGAAVYVHGTDHTLSAPACL